MRSVLLASAVAICSFSASAQQDPYDGQGDNQGKPDVWVTPTESGGAVITPGDNQPVDHSREGNKETLNFDKQPDRDSDVVITDD